MASQFRPSAPLHQGLMALLLILGFYLLQLGMDWSPNPLSEQRYDAWDTDSYSRVMQVLQLHKSGEWYNHTVDYFNAPYGMEMHWSRAFDIPLYLGAWIGEWFNNDFQTALELWGALLSGPLLLTLLLVVLLRFTSAQFTTTLGWLLLLGLLLLMQPAVQSVFRLGFIDHHGLLILLQLTAMTLLLDWVRPQPQWRSHAGLLGFVIGCSLWITIESLILLLLPVILLIGLLWIWHPQQWLNRLYNISISLSMMLVIALLLERPPSEWTEIEYDRLSIVHLLLATSLAVGASLLIQMERRLNLDHPWKRLATSLLVLIPIALLFFWLFPGLSGHPQLQLGPLVTRVLDGQPGEQPYLTIYPQGSQLINWLRDLGPLLLILPFLGLQIRQQDHTQQQRAFIQLGFIVLMLFFLLFKTRAIGYLQVVMLLSWIDALMAVRLWLRARAPMHYRYLWIPVFVLLSLGHHVPFQRVAQAQIETQISHTSPSCSDSDLTHTLALLTENYPNRTLLAPLWNGPVLAYRSGATVIGSPYHRNISGIEDGFTLLWSDPHRPDIKKLARERKVGYIFVCRRYLDQNQNQIEAAPSALISRLANNNPPAWLEPVQLSADLMQKMVLFRSRLLDPVTLPLEHGR